MKALKIIPGLFILIIFTGAAAYAQQQFTHTVTTQNRYCNSTCTLMDAPGLNNNPLAIILVTPVAVNGTNLNPHPIGAYYVDGKKWSIMNADAVAIPVGAKFNVEFYANPTPNQFVYVIPAQGVTPYIDHAGLNAHPSAKMRFFPTQSPRGAYFNLNEAKVEYDKAASKWLIANINNTPVRTETAYNIVIDFSGVTTTDLTKLPDQNPKAPVITPIDGSSPNAVNTADRTKLPDQNPKTPGKIVPTDAACNCPASLPPNGNAGGDLSGTYPAPTVQKLQGRPLSTTAPKVGQILKWNGTEWIPVEDDVAPSSASPAPKASVLFFNQSGMVNLYDTTVNTKPIVGLDNQNFTLAQSSRIVFHTVILAKTFAFASIQGNATGLQLTVEILNSSNAVVARATSAALLTFDTPQNLVSAGIGILPQGIYHTKVSVIRQEGGAKLDIIMGGLSSVKPQQGGQMIIQIFPD